MDTVFVYIGYHLLIILSYLNFAVRILAGRVRHTEEMKTQTGWLPLLFQYDRIITRNTPEMQSQMDFALPCEIWQTRYVRVNENVNGNTRPQIRNAIAFEHCPQNTSIRARIITRRTKSFTSVVISVSWNNVQCTAADFPV